MNPATPPRPSRLRRITSAIRYAWSDLTFRPYLLCICAGAMLVAATTFWQSGAISVGVHRWRRAQLAAQEPTRVTLLPEPGVARAGFTPELLDELARLSLVAEVAPKIELLVNASLGERPGALVPAEGFGQSGALPREALAFGRGLERGEDGALVTQSLVERLGGELGAAGPALATLTLRVARTVRGEDQEHALRLPIVGVLRRQDDPNRIDVPLARIAELERWCRGEDVPGLPRRPDARAVLAGHFDGAYLCFERAHAARLAPELSALGLAWEELPERAPGLRAGEPSGHEHWRALLGDPADGAWPSAVASGISRRWVRWRAALEAPARSEPALLVPFGSSWFVSPPADPLSRREAPQPGGALRRDAVGAGAPRARLVLPAPSVSWVRARRADGGPFDRELLARLELARPAISGVRPFVGEIGVLASERELDCEGVRDEDASLLDELVPLLAGRWPRAEREVALPSRCVRDSSTAIGQRILVSFEGGAARPALTLSVCGVVDAPLAYVPAALVAEVRAFRQGLVDFEPATERFSDAAARPRDQAWVRATLWARDVDAVAELVSLVRRRYGFVTLDRLAEHEAVQRLGRGLALLVALLVAGCLAVAAGAVSGMTAQRIQSRLFEIGVLLAHGIHACQVVLIYAAQGFLLGALAFAAALAVQLFASTYARALLAATFDLPADALDTGSPLGPPALVLAVLALCLVFPVLGATLPAAWTCMRLAPVEAIGRRE